MRALTLFAAVSLGFVASPALVNQHALAAQACKDCKAAMKSTLDDDRRAEDRARDIYRHPAETLDFFQVRPGMTVIDVMPSGGWWTRVLVPYLGKDGRYIGLNPALPANAPQAMVNFHGGLKERFPAEAAKWNLSGAPIEAFNGDQMGEDRKGTVDRALIFRSIHNMHRSDFLRAELYRLHGLLKPDGMLGIEQHRAKANAAAGYVRGDKGYMRQKDVIALIEAHGFQLVASSEINANAKDRADHPQGVWEMPPVLRTKREDLKGLGESDRMTLLFRKRP